MLLRFEFSFTSYCWVIGIPLIVDLGDIEEGETVEDTYFVVKEIVAELLEENIIPIIIRGDSGYYLSYL